MNVIDAIIKLSTIKSFKIDEITNGNNRANNAGDALELFVQNLFADSFIKDENKRNKKISETFSYVGNNTNPPDIMLKNGDAIEVKKIENENSALALNSSYPKHILKSTSHMINNHCRNAEVWSEKDIIYVVGVVKKGNIESLAFVYGMDYCASEECYSKIKDIIKNGVEAIPEIEFSETKELGHINKVDPLGITYLRVRGMWGIENPWKVFSYIYSKRQDKKFNFMCIINDDKFNSFDNKNGLLLIAKNDSFSIENVLIKNPDNPAQLVSAKLISMWR